MSIIRDDVGGEISTYKPFKQLSFTSAGANKLLMLLNAVCHNAVDAMPKADQVTL